MQNCDSTSNRRRSQGNPEIIQVGGTYSQQDCPYYQTPLQETGEDRSLRELCISAIRSSSWGHRQSMLENGAPTGC